MAKAINWPREFREEILAEDTHKKYCALRLGNLYFENQYWVPNEIVDIRVNHLKVRQAEVTDPLRQVPIAELTAEDFLGLKSSLQSVPAVVAYLAQTYQQPVSPESLVTLVWYRNQPLVEDEVERADDPHL